MVDIDGFKRCNDTLGHGHGDRVLCGVADAMSGVLRRSDSVFRIGGDEFAALRRGRATPTGALEMGKRMHDAVAAAALV